MLLRCRFRQWFDRPRPLAPLTLFISPVRPAKAEAPAVALKQKAPPKKRGTPPKGGETTHVEAEDEAAAEQLEEELVDAVVNEAAEEPDEYSMMSF